MRRLLVVACVCAAYGCSTPQEGVETGSGTTGTSSAGSMAPTSSTSTTNTPPTSSAQGSGEETQAGEGSTADLPGGNGCCNPHEGPGCIEPEIQDCVCVDLPQCCAFDWDASCVQEAVDCNAMCIGGTTTGMPLTTGPPDTDTASGDGTTGGGPPRPVYQPGGNCCSPMGPGVGCEVTAIEECTCAIDGYCCDTDWDFMCLQIATESCGAACGNCCGTHGYAGCGEPEIIACVCDQDDYCCTDQWDGMCVGYADGCGAGC